VQKQKGLILSEVEESFAKQSDVMSMQNQLRQAIFGAITEQDVSQIIKKQVEKAKDGDDKALQFVMKYALGFGQPVTLQQVNVIDTATAARIAKGAVRD
jgi:hypothetical protein